MIGMEERLENDHKSDILDEYHRIRYGYSELSTSITEDLKDYLMKYKLEYYKILYDLLDDEYDAFRQYKDLNSEN